MGRYINDAEGKQLPTMGKAEFLLANVPGVKVLSAAPKKWEPNIVCVVENTVFDAAGYAFDEQELAEFSDKRDNRDKTWLLVPNAHLLAR